MKINQNYRNLKESYLFSEVAKRANAYKAAHPDADIIRLGIGDFTLPLCDAVVKAFHEAADEMGKKETFKGYGPEQGYAFLRDAIRDYAPAFRAVYTPLFGTGRAPVTHMLSALGIRYSLVEAQAEPNGHFPGLSAPNPENPEAFSLAIRQADAEGANLILATDPDCDRLGVAVRNAAGAWQILTGNEIGCLLLEHLTSTRPLYPDSFAVKSIVSSLLADRIAAAHGVQMRQVLTGFKYIAQQIAQSVSSGEGHFLFGFEESYGFLGGTFVRDKDAAMATVLLAEAACCYARRGMSLFDALTELYKKYGFVREEVLSLTRGGQEGMAQIARAVDVGGFQQGIVDGLIELAEQEH